MIQKNKDIESNLNKEMQTTKEAESNSINPQNTESNSIKESTEGINQTESKLNQVNLNQEDTQTAQHIEKDLKQTQINFNDPIKQIKPQMLEALRPIFNQTLTSSDGIQAYMSLKSLSKMTSNKAIQKSIDNGFSREEHLKAVLNIQRLFENAKLAQIHKDNKGLSENVLIHRLNSELENGNALITTKESLDKNLNKIYSLELELTPRFKDEMRPTDIKSSEGGFNSQKHTADKSIATIAKTDSAIISQDSTKAQSEYFNSLTNEYEKIKEIKKLHTQDDNLIIAMKVQGRNDYKEPLSNMIVSEEYLQKQTAQSLKDSITKAILGNQTQLKALQQGYNTYHLSDLQKEVLESALDIANNPTKLKEYKLQGLQKQLNNLNSNEAYHIEKGREYDKARYAKDREWLEREITALKGIESNTQINKDVSTFSTTQNYDENKAKDMLESSKNKQGG